MRAKVYGVDGISDPPRARVMRCSAAFERILQKSLGSSDILDIFRNIDTLHWINIEHTVVSSSYVYMIYLFLAFVWALLKF